MRFDYSKYASNHGAMPRGTGNWAFCPADKYDRDDYLSHVMWKIGTFSQAKKQAAAFFGPRNVETVVVCP